MRVKLREALIAEIEVRYKLDRARMITSISIRLLGSILDTDILKLGSGAIAISSNPFGKGLEEMVLHVIG